MQISRILKNNPQSPSMLQIDDSGSNIFEVCKTDDGRDVTSLFRAT
jgi:hypothetical protein